MNYSTRFLVWKTHASPKRPPMKTHCIGAYCRS